MYKFNNYQYETYAEELYDIVLNNKENYIEIIKDIVEFYENYDDITPYYERNIIAAGVGTVTGAVTSIVSGIINKSSLAEILGSAIIVTLCGTVAQVLITAISAKQIVKETNEFAEGCYKAILQTLKETIENGSSISIVDIHEMTNSLECGEEEEKLEIAEGNKLEITMLKFDKYPEWIVEHIRDYSLVYLYEKLMYIAKMAYEGYEEDLLSAYDLIKEYIHAKKDKEHFDKNYYQEKFAYYEEKCARMASSRK